MRKFVNEEMSTPNVMRAPINVDVLEALGDRASIKTARRRMVLASILPKLSATPRRARRWGY